MDGAILPDPQNQVATDGWHLVIGGVSYSLPQAPLTQAVPAEDAPRVRAALGARGFRSGVRDGADRCGRHHRVARRRGCGTRLADPAHRISPLVGGLVRPGPGYLAGVNGDGSGAWGFRTQIDEPGLRASIVADVTANVSIGESISAAARVHVRQRRSVRNDVSHREQRERSVNEQQPGLSAEELDAASAEELPDREQMSLVSANVAVPVNAAVAANVLSDHSVADAPADQAGSIDQVNLP